MDYSLIYKIRAKVQDAISGFKRVQQANNLMTEKGTISGRRMEKTLSLIGLGWKSVGIAAGMAVYNIVKSLVKASPIVSTFLNTFIQIFGAFITVALKPFIPLLLKILGVVMIVFDKFAKWMDKPVNQSKVLRFTLLGLLSIFQALTIPILILINILGILFPKTFGNARHAINDMISFALKPLMDIFKNVFGDTAEGIGNMTDNFVGGFSKIIAGVGTFGGFLKNIFAKIWHYIKHPGEILPDLINKVAFFIGAIKEKIFDLGSTIKEKATEIVDPIIKKVNTLKTDLFKKLNEAYDWIKKKFVVIIGLFSGDPSKREESMNEIMNWIATIFDNILTFITNKKSEVMAKIESFLGWIQETLELPDSITKIVNSMTTLLNNTIQRVSSWIGEHLPELGKKMIVGIVQGIKKIDVWELVYAIRDKITSALGLVFHITPKIQAIGIKFGEILNKSLAKIKVNLPIINTSQMLKDWQGVKEELGFTTKIPSGGTATIDKRIYHISMPITISTEMKDEGRSSEEIANDVAAILSEKMRSII